MYTGDPSRRAAPGLPQEYVHRQRCGSSLNPQLQVHIRNCQGIASKFILRENYTDLHNTSFFIYLINFLLSKRVRYVKEG